MAITKRKIERWVKKGKVEKLMEAIQADADDIRTWASHALGKIGDEKVADSLAGLARDLGDSHFSKINDVFNTLIMIGNPAISPLIGLLGNTHFKVCFGASKALAKIGRSSVDPLIKAMSDPSGKVRVEAAGALGMIKDPKCIKYLEKGLADTDPGVCISAVHALGSMGRPESIKHLEKFIEHDEPKVRRAAIDSICKIGTDEAVIPLLLVFAGEYEAGIRVYLTKYLKIRGVQPLLSALDDPRRPVRQGAVQMLGELGWKPARDNHALNYYIIKADLEDYLTAPVSGGRGKVDSVKALLDHTEIKVRQNAAMVLNKIGWKPTTDKSLIQFAIIKAKLEKEINLKTLLEDGKKIRPRTIDSLVKILAEKNKKNREKAAGILDQLGWKPSKDEAGAAYYIANGNLEECVKIGQEAIPALIQELETKDKDQSLKVAAILGIIGGSPAVDALVSLLGDKNRDVSQAAVGALKQLYQSAKLGQEEKKVILKLKGQQFMDHHDHTDDYHYRVHDCDMPMVHTDEPAVIFDL